MTNKWQYTKITDLCRIVNGKTPLRSNSTYWNGGNVNWFTIDDMRRQGRFIYNTSQHITDIALKESGLKIIPKESVLVCCTASVGEVVYTLTELTTNQQFNALVPNNRELLDSLFLYYVVDYISPELFKQMGTTTFGFVSTSKLGDIKIPVPKIETQEKIRDILLSIDEAIKKTGQIIQKSEELKNGLMNELLTKGIGHKKFKKTKLGEIPEEWEIIEMKQITHNITDGKHGDCENESNSGFYFISVKDIRDGLINYQNARQITKSDFEDTHKRTKLEEGDLLLTNSGTIGRMAIVPNSELTARTTFQKSVAVIKPDPCQVNVHYLMYALTLVIKNLILKSSGSAQVNLLLKDLRSYKILLPTLKEQKTIAEIISNADKQIAKENKYKDELINLKSALMHDIFNQKVNIN